MGFPTKDKVNFFERWSQAHSLNKSWV